MLVCFTAQNVNKRCRCGLNCCSIFQQATCPTMFVSVAEPLLEQKPASLWSFATSSALQTAFLCAAPLRTCCLCFTISRLPSSGRDRARRNSLMQDKVSITTASNSCVGITPCSQYSVALFRGLRFQCNHGKCAQLMGGSTLHLTSSP